MTAATDTPTVRTEENDGILVITIDRPEARNAVDGATARALAAAVDRL
ncbi:enoyl-CoA hydratase, partial [Streptomyces sp. SID2955]|nr:enoyl-CoA hydratase [Streptomyces sp. SID2955]